MNIKTTIAVAAAAAALTAAAIGATGAAAMSAKDYTAALQGAGYSVAVDPGTVAHAALKQPGVTIKIDKGGKGATLEFIDYSGNRDALKTDWIAENGVGPRPRIATSDFAGRVLYWNDDSVLAVDFRDPNFREAAQAAGEIFLGRRGTGGPTTGSTTTSAPGTKLPATGSGPASATQADLGDFLLPIALLGAAGVLLAACFSTATRRHRKATKHAEPR
jgi:hypothetical protein